MFLKISINIIMLKNIRHPNQNEVDICEHPCNLLIDDKPQGTGCVYICKDKLVWVNQHFLGLQLYFKHIHSSYKVCNDQNGCIVLSYNQTKFQNQQNYESDGDDDDVIGTRACDFFDSNSHIIKLELDKKEKLERVFESITKYDFQSKEDNFTPNDSRCDSFEFMLESAAQSQQIDEQNLDSLNFK